MKVSFHGMTSEDASHKKKSGHKREFVRLLQLPEGSTIISGTTKVDIVRNDGQTESVKGGKKTQWALYTLNRILTDEFFNEEEKEAFKEWVDYIPDSVQEWQENREHFSKNPKVENLYQLFKDNPEKLISYFCGVELVNHLVILDSRNNVWSERTMNHFQEKIKGSIKEVYTTEGGKLVISGGEKNTILFELELRKGKNSHKGILFHSLLHRIIDCIS
jgi:hypothetical protein